LTPCSETFLPRRGSRCRPSKSAARPRSRPSTRTDLIPAVRALLAPRYAGAWFSHEDGATTCNFAAVKASQEDEEAVAALRDASVPGCRLPVRVVSVPRSERELSALVDAFAEIRIGRRSDVELSAVQPRVDLGQLVLSIPTQGDQARAEAMASRIERGLSGAGFPVDRYLITAVS
jgi:hypothetical protein